MQPLHHGAKNNLRFCEEKILAMRIYSRMNSNQILALVLRCTLGKPSSKDIAKLRLLYKDPKSRELIQRWLEHLAELGMLKNTESGGAGGSCNLTKPD